MTFEITDDDQGESAKVLGIVGSLRNSSYNGALLNAISNSFPGWVKFESFDIGNVPHYNQDVEESEIPEVVRELKQKVQDADVVVIASPEYNGSVSGVLKDALDWASRPHGGGSFEGKPVAMMSAVSGRRGGRSVLNHLSLIVDYLGGKIVGEPLLVQLAPEKFDGSGALADSETSAKIKELVGKMLESLPQNKIKQEVVEEALIVEPLETAQ